MYTILYYQSYEYIFVHKSSVYYLVTLQETLPDSRGLPCVWRTRQSSNYTRRRLCRVLLTAKNTRQTLSRWILLLLTAKLWTHGETLPWVNLDTWQKKITNGGRRSNGRVCRVSPCRHTAKSQCFPCARVGHTANLNEKNWKRFFALNHCTTLWLVASSNIISNYV